METTDRKLLGLLGLARRAGKLDLGADAAAQAVRKRRAKLLLLAGDLSPRTAEKMKAQAEGAGVRCRSAGTDMDALEAALGKRTGIVAVNDAGFAEALLRLCTPLNGGQDLRGHFSPCKDEKESGLAPAGDEDGRDGK